MGCYLLFILQIFILQDTVPGLQLLLEEVGLSVWRLTDLMKLYFSYWFRNGTMYTRVDKL